MARIIKISAIVIILIIVVTPLLQQHLNFIPVPALQENRIRKKRPENWLNLFKAEGRFAKEFEEYFNDNYGLRDLLIRLKNQVDYMLFHKSDEVVIGRDGWLFYKSVVEEEEVDVEKGSAPEWETVKSRMLRLHQVLDSRGIKLVVVPCPMKNSVYPEKLPANSPRRPSPTSFGRYRKFLNAHPEIITIDSFRLLMELKPEMQVYYRTDFHWTDAAAAHVARELVNRLGDLSGITGLWDRDIPIIRRTASIGGESRSLALVWDAMETAPFPDGPRMDSQRGYYVDGSNAYDWTYISNLPDKSGLIP
jgi:hypothetical protein